MGLFSSDSTNNSYLGVDVGGASLKMVELSNNKGRPQLVTYGFLEHSLGKGEQSLVDQPDKLVEVLQKVMKESNVTTKQAITALPSAAVFSSIISLNNVSRKDLSSPKNLNAAVEWEAKKIVPLPIEEMILDWKILGDYGLLEKKEDDDDKERESKGDSKKSDKISNLQVLLTGAAKTLVQKYVDAFKKADLNLLSLETESFALGRSLVGADKSVVLLVDIGFNNTEVLIIDNGIPYIDRSVNIGGYQVTKAITETLKINFKQAEQYKRDLENQLNRRSQKMEIPQVILDVLAPVFNEVQYIQEFFLEQPDNQGKKIEKIILSGGTANLFNLANYFSDKFNLRTFVGNPWSRVIYPEDIQPVLDQVGSRLAVSIGLAMREFE